MSPVDPPPGLLARIAEAICDFPDDSGECNAHLCDADVENGTCSRGRESARAAWNAVAEHLGLTVETGPSIAWRNDDGPEHRSTKRRLVSKWVKS